MASIRKISSTLSIAASVLLQACGSSSSDSGPAAVANTAAPELIGTWDSGCTALSVANTSTSASGGSQSGTANISRATFTQDGHVELSSERFASLNCNANTSSGVRKYNAVYFIGGETIDTNGSPVTEMNYSTSSSTTYTIFQVLNGGVTLRLGDAAESSPGMDGGSDDTRLDGLGADLDIE